jgi:hypothetical protein
MVPTGKPPEPRPSHPVRRGKKYKTQNCAYSLKKKYRTIRDTQMVENN